MQKLEVPHFQVQTLSTLFQCLSLYRPPLLKGPVCSDWSALAGLSTVFLHQLCWCFRNQKWTKSDKVKFYVLNYIIT